MLWFCILCLLLASVHLLLLLPSFSISSGELRLRGLYLDDNAIFQKSSPPKTWSPFRRRGNGAKQQEKGGSGESGPTGVSSLRSMCESMERNGQHICREVSLEETQDRDQGSRPDPVFEVILSSTEKPLLSYREEVLWVLPYTDPLATQIEELLDNLQSLYYGLHRLSRSVRVLLVPADIKHDLPWHWAVNDSAYSCSDLRLRQLSVLDEMPALRSGGLTREAYVIDLVSTSLQLACQGMDPSQILHSLQVGSLGSWGEAANMDVLSSLMHPTSYSDLFARNYRQIKTDSIVWETSNFGPEAKELWMEALTSAAQRTGLLRAAQVRAWWGRFSQVFGHYLQSIKGRSGPHAQLLCSNIDAVTIRLLPASTIGLQSVSSREKKGDWRSFKMQPEAKLDSASLSLLWRSLEISLRLGNDLYSK